MRRRMRGVCPDDAQPDFVCGSTVTDHIRVLLAVPAPESQALAAAAEAVGATVLTASDRAALVQVAKTHAPQIAILDLSPAGGLGGAAMASVVQQVAPGARIIFTGEDDERYFIEALVAGDMYLPRGATVELATFALKTLLIKTGLSRTGQYQHARKYNPKAVEATAMRTMSVKLAGARTPGQVAEIVKGVLADVLPFNLFAFCPAPVEDQIMPRIYVHQPTTDAQFDGAVATLRRLAAEVFGESEAIKSIDAQMVRQRLYGSLTASADGDISETETEEAAAEFHVLHFPLVGDREQPVGFVALFRTASFDVPQPVMLFVNSLLTLAALTLARQAEAHAETISTLKAIIESRSDGLMWIEPRRNPIIVNRRARQLLALNETGPVIRADVVARLREAELYDDFFGPDAKNKQTILKAKRLPGSTEPHQIELVRVFDDQRLPIGVLLLIREPARETGSGLEEFIENLGHEIKVPLNALMGQTEILLEGVEGALNAGQTDGLKQVLQSARKILGVFDYFSASMRMSSRGLKKRPMETDALFASVVADFKLAADKVGVKIETRVEKPADTLRVDEDQFRIVLANLVSNALKFSPDGGTIALVAQPASLDAMKMAPKEAAPADEAVERATTKLRRRFVELICTDNGPGVAQADRERIFERFVQADTPPRPGSDPGTGLGLAIAKTIVEAHGGRIWADSAPDTSATRFRIILPGSYTVDPAE